MELPNRTIEKDAFDQKVAIMQDMQKEIRDLNDKIKSLSMKADLDLTESSFIANQRKNQISFRTETNNRIRVIKDLNCGTANSIRNEAVSIPEIARPKLQCATFSWINPSKFEYKHFFDSIRELHWNSEMPEIQISLTGKLLNWLCFAISISSFPWGRKLWHSHKYAK